MDAVIKYWWGFISFTKGRRVRFDSVSPFNQCSDISGWGLFGVSESFPSCCTISARLPFQWELCDWHTTTHRWGSEFRSACLQLNNKCSGVSCFCWFPSLPSPPVIALPLLLCFEHHLLTICPTWELTHCKWTLLISHSQLGPSAGKKKIRNSRTCLVFFMLLFPVATG